MDCLVFLFLLFLLLLLSRVFLGITKVGIYVLAPLPNGFFAAIGDDGSWQYVGNWFTSVFAVSGLALPIVLATNAVIIWPAAGMAFGGSLIVYITLVRFITKYFGDDDALF